MPRRSRSLVVLACLAWLALSAGGPAAARAPRLDTQLGLFNRFGAAIDHPDTVLRWDPSRASLASRRYQRAGDEDIAYAVALNARFKLAVSRELFIGLDVDTGAMRPIGRRPARTSLDFGDAGVVGGVPTTGWDEQPTVAGRPLLADARETLFIRELYVGVEDDDELGLWLGRRKVVVGDGLLYDDTSLALRTFMDFSGIGVPLSLEAGVLLPSRGGARGLASPLVDVTVSAGVARFMVMALVFAWFGDSEGFYDDLLLPWLAERAVAVDAPDPAGQQAWAAGQAPGGASRGDLFWLGPKLRLGFGPVSFRALTLVQLGEVRLPDPAHTLAPYGIELPAWSEAGPAELSALGFGVDVAVELAMDGWSLRAFHLLQTGSDNPYLDPEEDLGAASTGFLGVVPHLLHTNLMLSGGLDETFTDRAPVGAGVNRRGLLVGGLAGTWEEPELGLWTEVTVAGLWSHLPAPERGAFYGVEVDVELVWQALDWLSIGLEYDVLVLGDFWPDEGALAHQARIGLDLTFESYEERIH